MQKGQFLPIVENIETTEVKPLEEPGSKEQALDALAVGTAGEGPTINMPEPEI